MPSLSLSLYIHSRGIARRREGTAIIYESRKSRSIDLSDRSRLFARSLVRTRPNVGLVVRGNTLTRDAHVYDATITAIAVTLVELYSANTISRVQHIRIHLLYIHCVYLRLRDTTWSRYYSSSTALCCHSSLFTDLYYSLSSEMKILKSAKSCVITIEWWHV